MSSTSDRGEAASTPASVGDTWLVVLPVFGHPRSYGDEL
jgi:hypothetical protein